MAQAGFSCSFGAILLLPGLPRDMEQGARLRADEGIGPYDKGSRTPSTAEAVSKAWNVARFPRVSILPQTP